jgi:hypothetical protein
MKTENYGEMFRFTEQSSNQIQNTVLRTLTECTSTVFCIWPDDGSVNPYPTNVENRVSS